MKKNTENNPGKIRIQKYLSQKGMCSRREAEKLLKAGRISLNGTIVTILGSTINPEKDTVEVHTTAQATSKKETILFYKPKGIVCSRNTHEGKTIYTILSGYTHLNIVGRLDKESQGLILLSNEGLVTKALTDDRHLLEKEYEIKVQEEILPYHIKKLNKAITYNGITTKPAKAEKKNKHTVIITIKEGKKHQLRRMTASLNLSVLSLIRFRIDTLRIGSLKPGGHRTLTEKEVTHILRNT